MAETDSEKYLKEFLKVAPLSHALWRATEALAYEDVELVSPILDLGCGFGEFSGVAFGRMEMGVDINGDELARALKGGKYKSVSWADARELPFGNGEFSTVISNSVLEHIENVERVLDEVHRVLRKGGKFVFTVPTTELKKNLGIYSFLKSLNSYDLAEKYFELHRRAFKHVSLKSPYWWKRKLRSSGFEVESITGTISPSLLKIHEAFLVTAFPSQLWKLLFGRRLVVTVGLRSAILPIFFGSFVKLERGSNINLFVIARKK
jgi:SAM-dependent methyltransferase